jgi:hypothetical protein
VRVISLLCPSCSLESRVSAVRPEPDRPLGDWVISTAPNLFVGSVRIFAVDLRGSPVTGGVHVRPVLSRHRSSPPVLVSRLMGSTLPYASIVCQR